MSGADGEGRAGDLALALRVPVVVEVVALGGALEVVEGAVANRAQHEGEQPGTEYEADGDREGEEAHGVPAFQRSKRTALPVTASDESPMAAAAASGSIQPAMASGIAAAL